MHLDTWQLSDWLHLAYGPLSLMKQVERVKQVGQLPGRIGFLYKKSHADFTN